MTSPPSPPNRRRRRIVVTIAVLVLGLGWWFWPRVDQRFVGTWSATDDDIPAFTLTLDGDGLGLCEIPGAGSGGGSILPMIWWVDGGYVVIGQVQRARALPTFLNSPADQLQRLLDRRNSKGERWKVMKQADGRIELHSPTPRSGRVLRRLEE